MTVKTNYVIASWGGTTKKRQTSTLHLHLGQLNKLNHSLAQVTIGRPHCKRELPQYTESIESITQLSDGTPVVVQPMRNGGHSYGQWSRVFSKYGETFSHYILIEDDYVPVVDHFDEWMVNRFDELATSHQCGYLCGKISTKAVKRNVPLHASVSNGISSGAVMTSVAEANGGSIPFGNESQITFSQAFIAAGFTLQEYTDQWRCRYWPGTEKLIVYGSGSDLIDPIQTLID